MDLASTPPVLALRRRSLLGALAAAPLAAAVPAAAGAAAAKPSRDTTIAELEVFRIPVNKRGDWIIVRLRTQSGLTGLGDASHGGDDAITVASLKRLIDLLRGRRIFDVEWFRQAAADILREADGKARSAFSALEQCLWDLMGKHLGLPVHQLLGGALRQRIPLYANINRSADPRDPDGFAAMARRAVDAGFDAIKLAPFDAMARVPFAGNAQENLVAKGIACAQAVRDAIGPSRQVLIDAHGRFTLPQGLELLRRLEPLKLYWIEEVTPENESGFADLAAINTASKVPTAGGEALFGAAGFYRYITAGAADIVMPDVKLCGGMLELKKIAALAEAAGLTVSPHGPASPVGGAAAAQVVATVPNFSLLEHAFGEVPWRAELLEQPEDTSGGALTLTSRPGLGIALNDRTIRQRAA